MCARAGYAPIRYFENFPDVKPFGARSSHHNKAEWIVDLTTRADREGKHSEYANRYDASELKAVNLKELDLQLDRGYRVCHPTHSSPGIILHVLVTFYYICLECHLQLNCGCWIALSPVCHA